MVSSENNSLFDITSAMAHPYTPTSEPQSASSSSSSSPSVPNTDYFQRSHRSSTSSDSSIDQSELGAVRAQATRNEDSATASDASGIISAAKAVSYPVDILAREFPKPQETSLDELLARTPKKWSLNHWVKNAQEIKAPVVSKDQQAKAFADTKAKLLASQAKINQIRKSNP